MKIKLLKKEEKLLDDYWNFVSIFIPPYKTAKVYGLYGPSDYRKDIIAKISKIYTVEQFYFYENMLNKMLWILIHHIDFDITKINKSEKCHYPLLFKTYNDNNYLENSFSHKEFIKDEINNLCYEYTNYPELSDIKIIHQIAMIISNRKLYDTIIKTTKDKIKNKLRNISIKYNNWYYHYYYPCDYAFPNVNFLFYNKNDKKTWIDRINRLYYNDNKDDEWYKFTRECVNYTGQKEK